jgi:hypothetical protein
MGWDGIVVLEGSCLRVSRPTSDTWMFEWLVIPDRSAWEVKTSLIPSLGRIFSSW